MTHAKYFIPIIALLMAPACKTFDTETKALASVQNDYKATQPSTADERTAFVSKHAATLISTANSSVSTAERKGADDSKRQAIQIRLTGYNLASEAAAFMFDQESIPAISSWLEDNSKSSVFGYVQDITQRASTSCKLPTARIFSDDLCAKATSFSDRAKLGQFSRDIVAVDETKSKTDKTAGLIDGMAETMARIDQRISTSGESANALNQRLAVTTVVCNTSADLPTASEFNDVVNKFYKAAAGLMAAPATDVVRQSCLETDSACVDRAAVLYFCKQQRMGPSTEAANVSP